jgi:thermitase
MKKSNIDLKKNAYYPASYGLSNIITVAAHDQRNKIISSSNWGEKSVDIVAPGLRIRSAIPGNGAGYMTGTSQATAFVTGVAALIKSQFSKLNFQQIKNVIISSSKKLTQFRGKILSEGKLDAAAAIAKAGQVYKKLYPAARGVARKKALEKRIKFLR